MNFYSLKCRITVIGASAMVASMASAVAATIPLYENNAPLIGNYPIVDATAFVNRSIFDVTALTGLPFESQNTRFFTNTQSGLMNFDPGVRFFRNTGGLHFAMDSWVNEGSISSDHANFQSLFGIFISDTRASILQVTASNIYSAGPLSAGAAGLVHLEGGSVDVPRIGLRTGLTPQFSGAFFGTTSLLLPRFVNDFGITDLYWGGGTNNAIGRPGPLMQLNSFAGVPNFAPPFPASPRHDVLTPFGTFFSIVPGILGSISNGYGAAVFTNTLSATSSIVQVVFYPTNVPGASLSTDVRFGNGSGPSLPGSADVIVSFNSSEFDIAKQAWVTNSLFLVDALASSTNVTLARNTAAGTFRPITYAVTTTPPLESLNSVPGNSVFSSNLISNPTYTRTAVSNIYAAYAVQVVSPGLTDSGTIPYDVTNVPGRVTLIADKLNLEETRIRSENALVIKTSNLVSNNLAQVDAPQIDFDVRSTQPTLTISNLAPATVRRLGGTLLAWSGLWQNQQITQGATPATNTIYFHVLIVDSQLAADVPVVVNRFAARGTDLVIEDKLNIGKSFLAEGRSLTFGSAGGLVTPVAYNLAYSNLVSLVNFTNNGTILVSGLENLGQDRATGYASYVNHGTNEAGSHNIRASYVENTGPILADAGPITIDANSVLLAGVPSSDETIYITNFSFTALGGFVTNIFTNHVFLSNPANFTTTSELRINTRTMTTSNGWMNAGILVLGVTNNISDAATSAISYWNLTNGFRGTRKPTTSSLFGTYVQTTVPNFATANHTWAGTDMGPVPAGFTNNMALGKLTLNGGTNCLITFAPATGVNAIYVDYLELLGSATNYNTTISIDPNFTIYFANANVAVEKLNGARGGRFKWVSDFVGPLSTTNIFYASTGKTYTFNIALVRSKDLDSDGDGIANADDPEPIYVPESAFITVELANAPQRSAILHWSALALSTNTVEFKSSAGQGNWEVLTNFVHGPFTSPVSIQDPVPVDGGSRLYRLKVNPLRQP